MKSVLLALDIATHLGWCIEPGKISGMEDFSVPKGKQNSIRPYKFWLWLVQIIKQYDVTSIAYERAAGANQGALIIMSEIAGVMKALAWHHNIQVLDPISPKTIKKSFTGSGNASKEDMNKEFYKRFKKVPESDDESDATALWLYINSIRT